METLTELLSKVSINNFDAGSELWVDVTHINNPHSFYVRPTVYREYLSLLNNCGDQPLPTELHLGSVVIYLSGILKCFVRGRILFIQNEELDDVSCDLFALDYGCYEKAISLNKLRKPHQAIDVPPLAVHCQLADCKPRQACWTSEATDSMKFFIGKERAKMVVKGKAPDSFIVQLFNSCPDDIATMLLYDGQAFIGYGENIISRFTSIESEKHFYKIKDCDLGDVLTVRVQTGDSLKGFFVAQVDDYKHYLKEAENFTYYCKTKKALEPEDITEGMAVGVFMITSNKYERALVTEIIDPERPKVMLVDWGKFMEVPVGRLRPMTAAFFERPAVAIFCCTEEKQMWDNGLHKFLYPGYNFNITILQVGEQFEAPHIVQISPV